MNGEFTTLMSEAKSAPNVVLACTNESRTQILEELTTGLERCQKALNEYLGEFVTDFGRLLLLTFDTNT
jgi:hypothetical protein